MEHRSLRGCPGHLARVSWAVAGARWTDRPCGRSKPLTDFFAPAKLIEERDEAPRGLHLRHLVARF